MHLRAVLGNLFLLSLLVLPSSALAARVVLTPLIADRGVDSEEVANLFALFSSELEFMTGVDEIFEVESRPPSLTTRCLESSRCLGAIAREEGGDSLIAGTVETLGSDYVLDIVFFEGSGIARRKTYTVPKAPTPLVNAITPVLVEVVTGVSPIEEQREAEMSGVSFDEEEDEFMMGAAAPEPEPLPERTSGYRARDERIVPPPAPEPEPVVEEDEFDPDAFELGVGSPEDISFGSVGEDEVEVVAAEPRRPARDPYVEERDRYYEDEDPYYDEPVDRVDLDEPSDSRSRTRREPRERSTASSTRKAPPEGYDYKRVYLSAKGGLSRYGIFTFGTVGAEVAVRVTGGLTIAVGAQAYIVRRAVDTAGTVQTNFIFPFNAGLLYRFKPGRFQPYAGVDAVFSQLLRDPTTGQNFFAFGGRVRGGFDYFFVPQVGLNVDIGLGVFAGEQWQQVDSRLNTIGFYPAGTIGFTFAF